MTSFLKWRWASENVQTEIKNGEFVSSESSLILAGPSRLSYLSATGSGTFLGSSNSLIPLGIVANFSQVQNQPTQRMFEIGSRRAYFIPGRMFGQFSLGRMIFYGPSLMRLLYALAPDRLVSKLGTPLNIDPDSNGQGVAQLPEYNKLFQLEELQSLPGYGGTANEDNRDFYINLSSELFRIPFGLCVVLKTAQDKPYAAYYLEDCYIESHQMSMDAGNVVIAENVTGQFDRSVPIQLATQTTVVS